jgi:hypothetical protein
MRGFFKDTELKKFTFEDKLHWVLRNIINAVNPVESFKQRERFKDYYGKSYSYSFPVCDFTEPKSLPESPFDDLKFWIENETCFIELENAKYQFDLSMTLRVANGLLKTIKKK